MHVDSLWAATADAEPVFPRLTGHAQADVVIIGGGYTGLSAAYHIAESGRAPLVLEANQIGWGASGRNGGVVSPKFRISFPGIASAHGNEVARRMYDLAYESVDCVEELVETLSLKSAGFGRYGHIAAAHTPRALAGLSVTGDWIKAEYGKSVMLSAEEVSEEIGTKAFFGGLLTADAGGIHPLNYARGLARGLEAKGVPVYVETPALKLRREGAGVVVDTPEGQVTARQVILATNGYSDLTDATKPIHQRLVPFRSAIIATAPLSANVRAQILPGGRLCGDTKRMLRWFRMAGDQLIFGGRGAFGRDDSPASFKALRKNMVELFPILEDTPIVHQWSGLVAMTLDALPHVGRLDDRTYFAVGYNGTGVAMASLMGRYLARKTAGEATSAALLETQPLHAIPFHAFRSPAVRLAAGWQQLLDVVGR
ncbi:FAD-binding oxidoreductase [Microvirga aerilata]|uniref:FAD-binding oxidoreductase n=2 Tax=Microvirga aerilata TaxID=670292 RepID=A0A936ZHT4_9HYPH|nr:FAD-binding oxidoreductase [Microvirga aerilata]MBL0406175.1 FAD-binding oxidoreductase [Microvirga aerilata]